MTPTPAVDRTPIAVAALVRDGLVLLVHRHPARRWYPDCWDLPGGHVEPGEPPEQAVVRECLEELGVRVHDPRRVPFTVTDPTLDVQAFLVTRWDGTPVNAEPDEHDDLGWFRPADLAGLTMAHPRGRAGIADAVRVAAETMSEPDSTGLSDPAHAVRGEDDRTYERNPRCAP